MGLDSEEAYNDFYDMEVEWEREEVLDDVVRLLSDTGDSFLSQEQLEDKGKLLGHFKSIGFLRTYIDIYEKAFIGKAEVTWSKKPIDIRFGYACLTEALVEEGILYLIMSDEKIYRLRYLKMAEEVAYRMNEQKRRTEG